MFKRIKKLEEKVQALEQEIQSQNRKLHDLQYQIINPSPFKVGDKLCNGGVIKKVIVNLVSPKDLFKMCNAYYLHNFYYQIPKDSGIIDPNSKCDSRYSYVIEFKHKTPFGSTNIITETISYKDLISNLEKCKKQD